MIATSWRLTTSMTECPSIKKVDEIRAFGCKPEQMERLDCLLHRLDTQLFSGFARELQKYLGVKQYMPPSYLRASALLGRPIMLPFSDHASNQGGSREHTRGPSPT